MINQTLNQKMFLLLRQYVRQPPPSFSFLVDNDGDFLVDNDGDRLVG